MQEKKETKILYSGSYGNTAWTIDEDGLLKVEGTGNMYGYHSEFGRYLPEWDSYAKQIKKAKIQVVEATTLSSLFSGCSNLKSVDLSGLDTSKVTYMDRMFEGCRSLTSLDLSGLDTSHVTDMSWMFEDCSSLTGLDLSGLDTSKVENKSVWKKR